VVAGREAAAEASGAVRVASEVQLLDAATDGLSAVQVSRALEDRMRAQDGSANFERTPAFWESGHRCLR